MFQWPEKNSRREVSTMPPMAVNSMMVCTRPATTFLHRLIPHQMHRQTAPTMVALVPESELPRNW